MTIETTITLYNQDVRKAIRNYIMSLDIFSSVNDILLGEVRFHGTDTIIVEIEDPLKITTANKIEIAKPAYLKTSVAYYEKEEASEAESDTPF